MHTPKIKTYFLFVYSWMSTLAQTFAISAFVISTNPWPRDDFECRTVDVSLFETSVPVQKLLFRQILLFIYS